MILIFKLKYAEIRRGGLWWVGKDKQAKNVHIGRNCKNLMKTEFQSLINNFLINRLRM